MIIQEGGLKKKKMKEEQMVQLLDKLTTEDEKGEQDKQKNQAQEEKDKH